MTPPSPLQPSFTDMDNIFYLPASRTFTGKHLNTYTYTPTVAEGEGGSLRMFPEKVSFFTSSLPK